MSNGYEYSYGGGSDNYSGGMDAMTGNNYGGGGFMDDVGSSGNKAVEKKASRDSQSLLPVSIKQLHSATTEDEQTKVDGVELHTVAIMGIVESVEEHSTNVNFKINDGTGVVEGKLWNDKDSSGGLGLKIANCRENSFVKIVGQLREYEGRKHVLIYDIAPVTDWNELTHHLLQIVYVHLQNTKGPIPGTAHVKGNMGQSPQASMAPGFNNMNQNQNQFQNQNNNQNNNNNQQGRGNVKDEHSNMKNMIKNILDTGNFNRARGMNIGQIIQTLQQGGLQNVSEGAIRSVCSEMTDDGVIYSTIDEDHFMST